MSIGTNFNLARINVNEIIDFDCEQRYQQIVNVNSNSSKLKVF